MTDGERKEIIERETSHLRSRYVLMYAEQQIELVDKALDYAVKMHDGQYRASGEPYVTILLPLRIFCSILAWTAQLFRLRFCTTV